MALGGIDDQSARSLVAVKGNLSPQIAWIDLIDRNGRQPVTRIIQRTIGRDVQFFFTSG
ncbi:MAG: hypothetical protein RLZZ444_846 [Pseudomonadota bacterium]